MKSEPRQKPTFGEIADELLKAKAQEWGNAKHRGTLVDDNPAPGMTPQSLAQRTCVSPGFASRSRDKGYSTLTENYFPPEILCLSRRATKGRSVAI
jgi:hypothetical protein